MNKNSVKRIGRGKYIVTEDITYYSPRYKKSITAHKGFIFDGYTIVPDLPDLRPSKIHDICHSKKKWNDGSDMTRHEADMILYDLMISSSSKLTRGLARIYYSGVRLFGKLFW